MATNSFENSLGSNNYKKIYTALAPVSYPAVKIIIYPTTENINQGKPIGLSYENKINENDKEKPAYLSSFTAKKIPTNNSIAPGAGTQFDFTVMFPPTLMAETLLMLGWNKLEISYGSSYDDPLYKVINYAFIEQYTVDFKPYGLKVDIHAVSKGFGIGDSYYVKQNDYFWGTDLKALIRCIKKKYPNVDYGIINDNIILNKSGYSKFSDGKSYFKISVGDSEKDQYPMPLYWFIEKKILPNISVKSKNGTVPFNESKAIFNVWTKQEIKEYIKNKKEYESNNEYSELQSLNRYIDSNSDDTMYINFFTANSLEKQNVPVKAKFVFNASDINTEKSKEGFLNRIISWAPTQNCKAKKLTEDGGETLIKDIDLKSGLKLTKINQSVETNNEQQKDRTKKSISLPANENNKEATEFQMRFLMAAIGKLEYTATMEVIGCSGFNLGDIVEVLIFDNFHHLLYTSGIYSILSVEDTINNSIFTSKLEMFRVSSYIMKEGKAVAEENKNKLKTETTDQTKDIKK